MPDATSDERPGIRRDAVLENAEYIRRRVSLASGRAGRDPADVRIVAAAKTVPADAVSWAVDAGIRDVGENYVKELRDKRPRVHGAVWHYIGNLQSHTAHHVADLADVVETVASARAAERGRRLDALIEIDLTGERAGVSPEELDAVADRTARLDGIRLVGLMTLPPLPRVPEDSRPAFERLRQLGERLRRTHPGAAELSMGMSLDYEIAVEEGATMVRIGTALFGERRPST